MARKRKHGIRPESLVKKQLYGANYEYGDTRVTWRPTTRVAVPPGENDEPTKYAEFVRNKVEKEELTKEQLADLLSRKFMYYGTSLATANVRHPWLSRLRKPQGFIGYLPMRVTGAIALLASAFQDDPKISEKARKLEDLRDELYTVLNAEEGPDLEYVRELLYDIAEIIEDLLEEFKKRGLIEYDDSLFDLPIHEFLEKGIVWVRVPTVTKFPAKGEVFDGDGRVRHDTSTPAGVFISYEVPKPWIYPSKTASAVVAEVVTPEGVEEVEVVPAGDLQEYYNQVRKLISEMLVNVFEAVRVGQSTYFIPADNLVGAVKAKPEFTSLEDVYRELGEAVEEKAEALTGPEGGIQDERIQRILNQIEILARAERAREEAREAVSRPTEAVYDLDQMTEAVVKILETIYYEARSIIDGKIRPFFTDEWVRYPVMTAVVMDGVNYRVVTVGTDLGQGTSPLTKSFA